MTTALATLDSVDKEAILKSLNLNPRDPKTQALLLVCDRYQLDPLLKHIVLIQGNAYVTRDGYLAVAHRSGQFDGMEVLEQSETRDHYVAKVAVWRKDMGRPFTFVGRFPKSKPMAKEYGPEMAVKVAEVQALRRAFNVTGVGAADERWDEEAEAATAVPHALPPADANGEPIKAEVVAAEAPSTGPRRVRRPPNATPAPAKDEGDPFGPDVSNSSRQRLADRIAALPDDYKAALKTQWKDAAIHSLTNAETFSTEDFKRADDLVTQFEESVKAAQEPFDE